MSPVVLQVAAVVIASFSLLVAALTYRRAGKWRDSDEGKLFVRAQDELASKVGHHDTRLSLLENEVKDLPTKQDLERLAGKIETNCQISDRTEKAVERIEDVLLKMRVQA